MRLFSNFFISEGIQVKFDTGIQNWMLILIFGSRSCFGDDFGQSDTETIILRCCLAKTPLRNSVKMGTPKVPGDQKLFERVCHIAGGANLGFPVQNRVNFLDRDSSGLFLRSSMIAYCFCFTIWKQTSDFYFSMSL